MVDFKPETILLGAKSSDKITQNLSITVDLCPTFQSHFSFFMFTVRMSNYSATQPVATKLPNELGLVVMRGYVDELWNDSYITSQTNSTGSSTGAIAASSVDAVGTPMPQIVVCRTVVTTSHHILEAICR